MFFECTQMILWSETTWVDLVQAFMIVVLRGSDVMSRESRTNDGRVLYFVPAGRAKR